MKRAEVNSMTKAYDIKRITAAVGRSATSVWGDRAKPSCPLHGDGMRRQRGGRRLVATPEVLQAYREWLCEQVPPAQSEGAA